MFWINSQECGSANVKVRNAAFLLVGELHSQLGPGFKALALSSCPDSLSIKEQLNTTFQQHSFDPSAAKAEHVKKCILLDTNADGSDQSGQANSSFGLDIPKTDLVATLPNGCISKMVSRHSHW